MEIGGKFYGVYVDCWQAILTVLMKVLEIGL